MAETTNPHDPHHGKGGGHGHGEGHGQSPNENPDVSYERTDVDFFQITAFGVGLAIATVVVVFAIIALFKFLEKREDAKNPPPIASMMNDRQKLPPEPHIQPVPSESQPPQQLQELRDTEKEILSNYGWIDQSKGIVRIPIAQAIDMVAAKGLPSKPSPAGGDNGGFRVIPSDASSGRTLEKISQ
jgi:hypothetical protein